MKSITINIIIYILLCTAFIIILLLLEQDQESVNSLFYVAILWILFLILILWAGNYGIHYALNQKLAWHYAMNMRLLIQLSASIIYSLLCINVSYYFFKSFFTAYPPDRFQMILLNIYGIIFLIPVISIQFGVYFMRKWKKVAVENESLEKEKYKAELISLRDHIDPHFLFNNLNVLSTLIDNTNKQAYDFLDNFSDVYRYVLQNRSLELVKLEEELRFLDAYIFLLKKRFEDQVCIDVSINKHFNSYYIPPLSLQLLVENALKHNKFSYKQPLTVEIYIEEPLTIVVKNNRQVKPQVPGSNNNTLFGLENLKKRYQLLSNKSIKVSDKEAYFIVKLPLLTEKMHEYIDR